MEKNILILTENFAPAWGFGGPPKALFDVARELVRKNYSVTVITSNVLDAKNEMQKTYVSLEGIHVYYLKTLSKWLAWNKRIFLPIGLRALLNKNAKDFEVIILPYRSVYSLIGYRFARAFNKRYVTIPYGSMHMGTGLGRVLKLFVDSTFSHRMLRNSSMVFAQTNHEVEEAKKFGVSETCVKLMPLNIDLSEFETLPSRGSLRKRLGIENDEKVILFLGRLHKYKGLELLLQAFFNLTRQKNNYRLVIVGRDDGYLSSLLKFIKTMGLEGKVIFVGPIYGKDRINAYVDADVFVMPSSHFEETSTAALEACAASTPVIVTKQASIPGLGSHKAGLTINYNQTELEAALKSILDNSELRDEMGENARKLVREVYSSAAWVSRFEEI